PSARGGIRRRGVPGVRHALAPLPRVPYPRTPPPRGHLPARGGSGAARSHAALLRVPRRRPPRSRDRSRPSAPCAAPGPGGAARAQAGSAAAGAADDQRGSPRDHLPPGTRRGTRRVIQARKQGVEEGESAALEVVEVLGVPVTNATRDEAAGLLESWMRCWD